MVKNKSEVKEVKQSDTWSCMACVAAMITGETLQDVVDFVGHDGSAKDIKTSDHPDGYRGFTNYDIAQYLMDRGYSMGVTLLINDQAAARKHLENKEPIPVTYSGDLPAYVSVKSERLEDQEHSIYWDGERVWDPNPDVDSSGRTLADYEILDIIVVDKFEWGEVQHWNQRHGKPNWFNAQADKGDSPL